MKKSIGARTLIYPTPVLIVGTYDREGKPNVMTAAWGGICCSSPPCVAVSLRQATYTYGNVMENREFTISIPSVKYAKEADYFGLVSGKREDKFQCSGLTPVKAEHVNAPYVGEFPLVLECKVLHVVEIGLHTQFIGEILDVKVDEDCLPDGRHPDVEKIRPFCWMPDSSVYYALGEAIGKAFSLGKQIGPGR
jgi:flavin reductase (DIM6/NTAB) family NADH-FMN oxidoreductase RutF